MAHYKIYVSTYCKYASGTLSGAWLKLPMSKKNLFSALRKVANREREPEFMIQDTDISPDYEDFREISESENIVKLNEELRIFTNDLKAKKKPAEILEAIEEYKKVWTDQSMIEYCMEKISAIFKTETGFLVEFEKPSIEKSFCFCEDVNGAYVEEYAENARNMAYNVAKTKDYFFSENMDQAFSKYEKAISSNDICLYQLSYYGCPEPLKICHVTQKGFEDERKNLIKLSAADIEGLKKILNSEKEKFCKRLSAWWNRYGAAGLRTWTYYSD